MRLFSFSTKEDASRKIGVGGDAEDSLIVDITKMIPTMKRTLGAISGDSGASQEDLAAAEEIKAIAVSLSKGEAPEGALKQSDVKILAPVQRDDSEKIFCIGMNYKMHCEEQGFPIPTEPVIFNKLPHAIADPGDILYKSPGTSELDFEVELAIVMGATCKHVKRADAMKYVAGYTVAHDVSMRDWQLKRNSGQWGMGKAFDQSAPLGPSIVTVDTLGDPHKLNLSCVLNGETVQDSNTSDLIFDTGYVVEWITQFITLSPGDVILTGTPQGVGCFRKPPLWLKAGDEVTCSVEKIGSITNVIQDEKVPEGAPVLAQVAGAAAAGGGGD